MADQERQVDRRAYLRLMVAASTVGLAAGCGLLAGRPESENEINLRLSIDQQRFLETTRIARITSIPETDPKDRTKRLCPSWSRTVCFAKYDTRLRIGINQPMAEYMFLRGGMFDLPLTTTWVFQAGFKAPDGSTDSPVMTGFSADGQERHILVLTSFLLWKAFQEFDAAGLKDQVYFPGFASTVFSRVAAGEIASNGAVFKAAYQPGQPYRSEVEDLTQDQVMAFRQRYERLSDQAYNQGRGIGAIIFAAEVLVDISRLRLQIFQEAATLGLK